MDKGVKVNELKAELVRNDLTQYELANSLGLSKSGLWKKMQGHNSFTLDEVRAIKNILKLNNEKIIEIFLN